DDGSPDLATSIEFVKGFKELGYKKIITTPHILWEVYPNTAAGILEGLQPLQKAVADAGIDIEIQAAAEYFIDEYFQELLKHKERLLTISGNMVLVEISMLNAPMDLQEVLFEMQMQDYVPVIAHPERYVYLSRNKEFFEELRTAGCLFQLNLLSVTGHYGNGVKELAEYLLKNNFYDFAGTDLHHHRHLEGLQKLENNPLIRKLQESGRLKNREL
nr:hypothetical protein [Flavisolibacter sp.]